MNKNKFRAWDSNFKKWIRLNGSIGNSFWREGELCGAQEYILFEQYTGLKGKNGTEIYEGDIVKLDSWEGVQQIVFIEGAFCLADKHGWYVGDIHYINHADKNQATIIGNIRENPELLKEAGA